MIYENMEVSGSLRAAQIIAGPKNTRANRPTSPASGSLFLETSASGSYMMVYTAISNNDDGWERISSQQSANSAFKYRTIINYAYLGGGYKDSSPWKNVHKTIVATDQTSHVGSLLDYPASYTKGACSKTIFFVLSVNTANNWTGPDTVSDTYVSAVNMSNDTNYAHQTKFDLKNARSDMAVMFKETEIAYIVAGGTTTVDKLNMANESIVTGFSVYSFNSSEGASAFSDENYAYAYNSGNGVKFNFANETFTNGSIWGAHGQQKGISSKVGKGYAGNEGSYNGGYNLRRWTTSNDTNIGTVAKPDTNTGEENFTMGQDWQYMLGNYNGAQNNNSWKFYYATDSGSSSISGLNPGVNGGTSSGANAWRG
jgi:hypothetical protein